MKKYIFVLTAFSIPIVAMYGPDADDAHLTPLALTETVEYDDGDTMHAFYNPIAKAVKVIKLSSLFPHSLKTYNLSLSDTFKNFKQMTKLDVCEKFSEVRTLGLAKLPQNYLLYAALAKTLHDGHALVTARFDVEITPADKWASNLFYTKGKFTSVEFFINLNTAKIVCETVTEKQNRYEKMRTYTPLNFSDPISSKMLESGQIEN